MNNFRILITLFIILLFIANLFGDGRPYRGPDDPAGDIAARREAFMNGNRVLLYFLNNAKLAGWPRMDTSKWPNDYRGSKMLDGVSLALGARVYIENDSIPVTDLSLIQNRTDLDTLYYIISDGGDVDPTGTIPWSLYPVFGYFNENSEHPAISNREDSWPVIGWPAAQDQVKWPGEWNGRFGRGIAYADQETYFVANDAQDQEYLQEENRVKYYPRPGKYIGDKLPSVTIQPGKPWGGVGLRIEVRGFQWNNPQSRDAIFWEYNISNISDYDLAEMSFGYAVDNGIGNPDWADEIGYFDDKLDMAYSWDHDGIGAGGIATGTMGIAFLESPGISDDNMDNDDDGLIDEKRDNVAEQLIGPYDGISNLDNFLEFYNLTQDQLKEHWDADEDQDWKDGIDANGDGIYQSDEYSGDDVGLDGVAPGDINYTEPDEGECNHKPDFLEGWGSEPNFALTDVSESDMLGLTSFKMIAIKDLIARNLNSRQDREFFNLINSNKLEEFYGVPDNLMEYFSSGIFSLQQGHTERISMAIVHSFEDLNGLTSPTHNAPALFKKKEIVQIIYETDYRFAQPPEMPTLKATAGDGRVVLTWDNVADFYTSEPLLDGINDFEGYKLYRASDKYFSDAEKLTDVHGNIAGKKPIFQCDIANRITGVADFTHINGLMFYLGDDTGIQHYYVDENVENGRTYYYGIAAYDYGIDALDVKIMPSENNLVIDMDEWEQIQFIGKNVQVVTPRPDAAGYIPPELEIVENDVLGSATVTPDIYDIQSVKPDHTYKLKFSVDTLGFKVFNEKFRHPWDLYYYNNGMMVYDVTEGNELVYWESPDFHPIKNMVLSADELADRQRFIVYDTNTELFTDPFDGLQLKMNIPLIIAEPDTVNTGWIVGDAPINVRASATGAKYYPWTYDIIFSDQPVYTSWITKKTKINDVEGNDVPNEQILLGQSFNFYVVNRLFPDSTGEATKADVVLIDVNESGAFERESDYFLVGPAVNRSGSKVYWNGTIFHIDFQNITDESQMPKANDVYRVDFIRPFTETDSILFKVKGEELEIENKLASDMKDIKVVPNPYVATNMMESAVANPYINQPRRFAFTHIPAQCTITILTSSGMIVDEIFVNNDSSNGIVHWDLLTNEGLEIAPGIYIYHVKSSVSDNEKIGKFAVIK